MLFLLAFLSLTLALPFASITSLVGTLPQDLQAQQKRLWVIGDVHGCLDELNALLVKMQYEPSNDQLIFTGDLVGKGPKSVQVVQRVQELNGLTVRGNHDDKVIRWKGFLNEYTARTGSKHAGTYVDESEVPEGLKLGREHQMLANLLPQPDYEFLRDSPLILVIPDHAALVVHAGLDPRFSLNELDQQDPMTIMTMRSIDQGIASEDHQGTPWYEAWNEKQRESKRPWTVYYGHDARKGLQLHDYTVGVDTGCVNGRELTAIEIPTRTRISVPCQRHFRDADKTSNV
ncbi:hypothetical protein BZG36_04925 [Bifiguratus adelaidae]|uniref:Calcineurin-like phosphoesterase domain-containing protein n=1 Tax=Bifiguratus adelaidae TaxID=1938954 RepID=A0A261XXC0_9FUNG|nr:hypothetical protein BZG36_04925 [Bifiguratus adelaidae]